MKFRGEVFTVRELTFVEKLFVSAQSDFQDKSMMMVVLGTQQPRMTQAEAETKPAKLIERLLIKISRLSSPEAARRRK